MDIAGLRAFVTVVEAGSFSAAADQLHITQPAISKRIAGLEQNLEKVLFDRNGRAVRVTEAGDTLFPAAKRIVQSVDAARDRVRSLGSDVTGRLSIATSHHIGIHRLPQLLREFTARYPDVELDLQFTDSELAADDVQRGKTELAVATLPLVANPALLCTPIWRDDLVVVCNRQHGLLGIEHPDATALAAFPAVLPSRNTITREIVTDFLKQAGVDVRLALETNYLETIRVMVEVGLGWSVLPRNMIGEELVAVGIDGLQLERTLGLMRVRAHTLSVAASHFVEAIESVSEYSTSDHDLKN